VPPSSLVVKRSADVPGLAEDGICDAADSVDVMGSLIGRMRTIVGTGNY